MPRKLRRFIKIDRKLLETIKDDKEQDKKTEDFTVVHTEKEFNEKCSQNARMKNVHYLIQDQCQNHFKWQKSNGPISSLKKHLIMNKECAESIAEKTYLIKIMKKSLSYQRSLVWVNH